MDDPNIVVIASTIDCNKLLQFIVLILLFIYVTWMIYNCFIKDISEYIQRRVSSWVRSQLHLSPVNEMQIASIDGVLSDTIEEYAEEIDTPVTHVFREYTHDSGHRVIEHTFNDSYVVLEIYDILTKEDCAAMRVEAEKAGLEESMVMSYNDEDNTELDTDTRRSSNIFLSDSLAPVFKKFADATVELTGIPLEHQEETQVVFYKPRGIYTAHYDGCVDGDGQEYCIEGYGTAGDRLATLLVYINDGYTGGQTKFTKLDFAVTPEIGKGILFYNIDKNEKIIYESEHSGSEVIKGHKWIATKWVHIRPF